MPMAAQTKTPAALSAAFTRRIQQLSADLARRFPADDLVARAHKRVGIAASVSHRAIVEQVGPYLLRYSEQIFCLDPTDPASLGFFLDRDYAAELAAARDAEKADLVAYIIPRAKQCARDLPPADLATYCDLVVELLSLYLDFLEAGG